MTTATKIAPAIPSLDQITSVYSGKAGRCCCGCAGMHRYASRVKDQGMALRGYEIRPEEVNDRQITKIYGFITSHMDDPTFELCQEYCSIKIGTRLFVAYFRGQKGGAQ